MHLCQTLSIEPGQTTKDGLITLQPAECMGACADAPVLLVNDVNMCSFMGHDKIDRLIEGLKQEAHS
jgi:NADH-quinone oxidoreductase subunit E